MIWDVIGWIAWIFVLLLGISNEAPGRIHDKATDEVDQMLSGMGAYGHTERRVLGMLLLVGCVVTIITPISKLHLLWWPFGAWFLWLSMIRYGPKILIGALVIFFFYRFGLLGWSAIPGNLRFGAMLMMGLGAATAIIGPSRSLGAYPKRGSFALLAIGTIAFLVLQFF